MRRLATDGKNILADLPSSYLLPPLRQFIEDKKGEPMTEIKRRE